MSAVLSVILGMGMPTVGVYILLATLIAPSLIEMGVEPIAAHLFVMYFGMMSMITPPVAIAAFTASVIAQAPAVATSVSAVGLAWTAIVVPFVFVFEPAILLSGPVDQIIVDIPRLFLGGLAALGKSGRAIICATLEIKTQCLCCRWRPSDRAKTGSAGGRCHHLGDTWPCCNLHPVRDGNVQAFCSKPTRPRRDCRVIRKKAQVFARMTL